MLANSTTKHAQLTELNNAGTQNLAYFPIELWEKIITFCDIQTTCTLSVLSKIYYRVITPLLQRKIYQQKVSNNCLSYSIKSYKSFISPILENFDLETKIKIDQYLFDNQNESNINILFPKFVFSQLNATATKLFQNKGLVMDLCTEKMLNFAINSKSNHFAIVKENSCNLVYIYQIKYPVNIEILYTIFCLKNSNEDIENIQFTPQNNLLAVISNSNDRSTQLMLVTLNLTEDNNIKKIPKIWKHKLDYYPNNVIVFSNSNDKKMIITNTYNIHLYKAFVLKIEDDGTTNIEEFVLYNKDNIPYKYMNDFIFSDTGFDLAMINAKTVHLFTKSTIKESFTEKSLPILDKQPDLYSYRTDLKFNKSGSLCVFINDAGWKVVMLNKINGKWCLAMILLDSVYRGLGLSFDEKNLVFVRLCTDYRNYNRAMNLEFMPIEDKKLTSLNLSCYIRQSSNTIEDKNFYPLEQDTDIFNFTLHPSALAIFALGGEGKLKIIVPKRLTQAEKFNIFLTKARYYLTKFLF